MGLFRRRKGQDPADSTPREETFTIGGKKVTVTASHVYPVVTVECSASTEEAENIRNLIILHLKQQGHDCIPHRQDSHTTYVAPKIQTYVSGQDIDFLKHSRDFFAVIKKECTKLMQKAPDKEKAEAMLEEYHRIAHGQETSCADQSAAMAEQEAEQKSYPYRAAIIAFLEKNRPDIDPESVGHFQEKILVIPINQYSEYRTEKEIADTHARLTDAFCTGAGEPLNDDEKQELHSLIAKSLRQDRRRR